MVTPRTPDVHLLITRTCVYVKLCSKEEWMLYVKLLLLSADIEIRVAWIIQMNSILITWFFFCLFVFLFFNSGRRQKRTREVAAWGCLVFWNCWLWRWWKASQGSRWLLEAGRGKESFQQVLYLAATLIMAQWGLCPTSFYWPSR